MNFETACRDVLAFRDEREWAQFHNSKDLAISLSLEAAELLECFQWSASDLDVSSRDESIREELADVLIYAIYFADSKGIDLASAIESKLAKNRDKYPVSVSRGSSKKYTELDHSALEIDEPK